ncbi:MAG: homoserine O-succinyltransferase [Bacteroidales bacterium]|jgi:homoserine O-succinyltransferase|nr:homoserine O-succinyltransferase [Bacteroidales bacterium]
MPVNIPDTLPASEVLKKENVFVMHESRALKQDIRPIKIGILNLMPLKEKTETHLIRMLSNTPLQIEIVLLNTQSHTPKHTSRKHLDSFYKSFADVEHSYLDGLIITGAPIELLDFHDVLYWKELTQIYDWADKHVTSTFHICWGAQAALYYYYGIQKYELPHKLFGVFPHKVYNKKNELVRGFDDVFYAPHSRYTYTRSADVKKHKDLEIISESDEAGLYLLATKNKKHVFVTGHSEYDPITLRDEYERDKKKDVHVDIPKNYFPQNDPNQAPNNVWKAHGNLLFSNWLNFYVYQETPYAI